VSIFTKEYDGQVHEEKPSGSFTPHGTQTQHCTKGEERRGHRARIHEEKS